MKRLLKDCKPPRLWSHSGGTPDVRYAFELVGYALCSPNAHCLDRFGALHVRIGCENLRLQLSIYNIVHPLIRTYQSILASGQSLPIAM